MSDDGSVFAAAQVLSQTIAQLITLSAGMIAADAIFGMKVEQGSSRKPSALAVLAWGLQCLSIVFGVLSLQALVANLDEKLDSIFQDNVGTFYNVQLAFFVLGFLAIALHVWKVTQQQSVAQKKPD